MQWDETDKERRHAKVVYRDAMWAAITQLAKDIGAPPLLWSDVKAEVIAIEHRIAAETFWGTPLPLPDSGHEHGEEAGDG